MKDRLSWWQVSTGNEPLFERSVDLKWLTFPDDHRFQANRSLAAPGDAAPGENERLA
jgi:hypothetical protein